MAKSKRELLITLGADTTTFAQKVKRAKDLTKELDSNFKRLASSNKEFESSLDGLAQKQDYLTERMEVARSASDAYNDKLKEQQEMLNVATQKFDDLQDELKDLEECQKNSTSNEEWQKWQTQIDKTKTEIEATQKEMRTFQNSIISVNTAFNKNQTEINKMNNNLAETKVKMEMLKRDNAFKELSNEISEADRKFDNAKNSVATFGNSLSHLTMEEKHLETQMGRTNRLMLEYKKDIAKSTSEMKQMEQKSQSLTNRFRTLNEQVSKMDGTEGNYKQLSDELSDVSAELTSVNTIMQLHRQRVENLNTSYNKSESELSQMTGKLKQVRNEINTVAKKDTFTPLERSIESTQHSVELLDSKMEVLRSSFLNFENSIQGTRQETEMLKQQVEQLGNVYKEQQSLITSYSNHLKSLESELKQVESEIKQTKQSMQNLQEGSDDWNRAKLKLGELENQYEELDNEIQQVTNSLRQAQNQANGTLSQMNGSIRGQMNSWNALSNRIKQVGGVLQGIGGGLQTLGGALTPLTVATTALGGGIIKTGAEFEESMSKVQALSGANTEQLEKMSNKARELGKQTTFTAKEAADGLQFLALAGYGVDNSMKALPIILASAKAGSMDLATCSDLATDALGSLGENSELTGNKIENLNELMNQVAHTSANSNTSMQEALEAYIKVGGQVDKMNIPLSTANTMLAILGDQGIKGAEAGTSLNSILINLTKATGESAEALKRMGVSAFDTVTGKMRPIEDVLGDIKYALKEFDDEQAEIQLSNMLGGKTQAKTLSKLLQGIDADTRKFTDDYKELKKEIESATEMGALEKMKKAMSDNLQTDFEVMKSMLSDMFLDMYDDISPKLRKLVQSITDIIGKMTANNSLSKVFSDIVDAVQWLVDAFANLSPNMQEAILKFVVIGGVLAPLIMTLGGVVSAVGSLVNGFGGAVGILGKVKTHFNFVENSGATLSGLLTSKLGGAVSSLSSLFSEGLFGAIKTVAKVALPALAVALGVMATLLGDNKNYLNYLIDEFGVFGEVLAGLSEFMNGLFKMIVGQFKNLFGGLGKSFLKIIKLDFVGAGEVWSETWSEMQITASEASENLQIKTTASIRKLKNMSVDELTDVKDAFSDVYGSLTTLTTENTKKTAKDIAGLFADSKNEMVGLSQGSIDILSGTSDTMRLLFDGIREGMNIEEATSKFETNLFNMVNTGRVSAEDIQKDFKSAWELIDKNTQDGGARINNTAEKVLTDFSVVSSGKIKTGASSIAKSLSEIGAQGTTELKKFGENWEKILDGTFENGKTSSGDLTKVIMANLKKMNLETPEQLAEFRQTLQEELETAQLQSQLDGAEIGESINEGVEEGVEKTEEKTGEKVKESTKKTSEKAKEGAVEGFAGLPDEVSTQLEKIGVSIDAQGNVIQKDLTEQGAKGAKAYVDTFEQESQKLSGVASTIKGQLDGINSVRFGGVTKQLSEINKWLGKVQTASRETEKNLRLILAVTFGTTTKGLSEVQKWLQKDKKASTEVAVGLREITRVTFGGTTKGLSEVQRWLLKVNTAGHTAKNTLRDLAGVRFGGVTSGLSSMVGWLDRIKSKASRAKGAVAEVSNAKVRTVTFDYAQDIPATIADTSLDSYTNSLMRNSVNLNNYKTSGGYYEVQDIMKASALASTQANAGTNEMLTVVLKQNELLLQLLNRESVIEVGLNVDGRQLARTSARYVEGEVSKLKQRKNRLGGVS